MSVSTTRLLKTISRDVQEGESLLFDEEEEGRMEEEEEGGRCRMGVVAVPSRLLMLYKLFNSCLTVVRERQVGEKRNRRLVSLFSLQLARLTQRDSRGVSEGLPAPTRHPLEPHPFPLPPAPSHRVSISGPHSAFSLPRWTMGAH
jgi:hypothetical protein